MLVFSCEVDRRIYLFRAFDVVNHHLTLANSACTGGYAFPAIDSLLLFIGSVDVFQLRLIALCFAVSCADFD